MSTYLTIGFCLVIFVLLVDFLRRRGTIPQGPAILTMVGIAGTFLGIAIGLARFNTADISGSIPRLIDGMKIAVWASFAGVLAAIILKYRDSMIFAATSGHDVAEADEAIDGLGALAAARDTGALVDELKILRRDLGERISRIDHSLEFFAERFARENAKALSEVLLDPRRRPFDAAGIPGSEEQLSANHVEST